MSLKRQRNHFSGMSNLDFRTKGDIKRIKFYQPYHESKLFGIQGLSNYKLPFSLNKKIFSPTKGLNEGKFIKNEIQNPKVYESAVFYRDNSMKLRPKIFLRVEKSKNLDTSEYRGGSEYNGDSMMIADSIKKRKEIKMEEKLIRENLKKKFTGNNIKSSISEYSRKNMIKSKSDVEIMEKKENKKKLNMIRNKIFERLRTHDNIKQIFLNWQNNYLNNKELSIFDLHKIINNLGIPITYNETLALIASGNKRNSDKLNYDEFKNLLVNDESNIDIDLNKITYQNESLFEENHLKEKKNMENNFKDLNVEKSRNFYNLKKLTRNIYPNFLQAMSKINNATNDNNNDEYCDFNKFKTVLKSMKIPEKYKSDEIINTIFNKYKISDKDLMNYNQFIESSKTMDEHNDFFHFQNGYLNLIQKKLEKGEEERQKYNEILTEDSKRKKNYLQNQLNSTRKELKKNNSDNNITNTSFNLEINKEKKYSIEEENQTEINNKKKKINNKDIMDNEQTESYEKNKFYNHYQPSKNFIDFTFKDNKLYDELYYKSIEELSPLIQSRNRDNSEILKKNFSELDKKKFESLSNSRKFKKDFLSDDIDDDKKRFIKYEISQEEKKNKLNYMQNSLKRKFETNRKWNDKINFQQKISDINNSLGQLKRTERLLRYEKKIYDLNNQQ